MITNSHMLILWSGLLLAWGFCVYMKIKIDDQKKVSTKRNKKFSSKAEPKSVVLKPYDLLDEIETTTSVSKKAAIFIDLMRSKYVLIHTLTNEGNMYNDKLQVQRFEHGLTDDVIKYINCIEGRDIC